MGHYLLLLASNFSLTTINWAEGGSYIHNYHRFWVITGMSKSDGMKQKDLSITTQIYRYCNLLLKGWGKWICLLNVVSLHIRGLNVSVFVRDREKWTGGKSAEGLLPCIQSSLFPTRRMLILAYTPGKDYTVRGGFLLRPLLECAYL